jgi:hypothetical protein
VCWLGRDLKNRLLLLLLLLSSQFDLTTYEIGIRKSRINKIFQWDLAITRKALAIWIQKNWQV